MVDTSVLSAVQYETMHEKDLEVPMRDGTMLRANVTRPTADAVKHDHVMGNGILHAGVESEGSVSARDEIGRGEGIAARKQCHVMALPNQFFGQVMNDAFRTSIEFRWHALDQRGYLRDFHVAFPPFRRQLRKSAEKRDGSSRISSCHWRHTETDRRPLQAAG